MVDDEGYSIKTFVAKDDANGFALGINLVVNDTVAFLKGFRIIVGDILQWKKKFGDSCEHIELTITSYAKDLQSIEEIIDKMYYDENKLAPIFQSLSLNVNYLNEISQFQKKQVYRDQLK